MDNLEQIIHRIRDLVKSLKPGTVAGGRNMPTITQPTSNIKAPSSPKVSVKPPKMPGVSPESKVNPIKSAEQTQNKDIKDIKMKEAQSVLKIKPMVKVDSKTGQWSL